MSEYMITVEFGIKKLHRRVHISIVTGEDYVDEIIRRYAQWVNENADEIDRLNAHIEELERERMEPVKVLPTA